MRTGIYIAILSLLLAALTISVAAANTAMTGEAGADPALQVSYSGNHSVTINGITFPYTDASYGGRATLYDKPLSKDEFIKVNAEHIKFLENTLGKRAASKMADKAFHVSSNQNILAQASLIQPFSVSRTIRKIDGRDIYIWPYLSQLRTSSDPNACSVNFIVFNKDASGLAIELLTKNLHQGRGWTEYGLHGQSDSNLVWTDSPGIPPLSDFTLRQLEEGSYFGKRYHIILIDGHYSNSLKGSWCYGNIHYEYWDWKSWTHILYPYSLDKGRDKISQILSGSASQKWVSLSNSWQGVFNGWGLIFTF